MIKIGEILNELHSDPVVLDLLIFDLLAGFVSGFDIRISDFFQVILTKEVKP